MGTRSGAAPAWKPEWQYRPTLAQVAAAKRVRVELQRADEGNYGRHGWAGYMAREDVEAVVAAVIG